MLKDSTKACILVLVLAGLWGAAELWAEVAGPPRGYVNLVAAMHPEYANPRVHQRAAREIEDLVKQNGFFLSGVLTLSQVIDEREMVDLKFSHPEHGTEILISTIRKPNVLDVYVFDRLRKGAWPDIKDKIEAAMQRIQ